MSSGKQIQGSIYSPFPIIIPNSETSNSQFIASDLLNRIVPPKDCKEIFNNARKSLYITVENEKQKLRSDKKKRKNERVRHVSRKERKKLGLLKCPTKGWNYGELEPLRNMWQEHILEVLNTTQIKVPTATECISYNRLMSRADLHGAEMEVIKARNPTLVGLKGTCVIDSRDTFGIVTKKDQYKIIPKEPCVFKIILKQMCFIIFGKYMLHKPDMRSTKKIKNYLIPTL